MKRLKHITRFFGRVAPELGGNGLFASLDELIEQRQYVAYLRQLGQSKTFSSMAGDVKSAFKGRGMELEEIRSYTYGDDVRDIDWRVTARKEQPFTKLYAEERDREIYALLDLSPQMVFGTRHELKSVAAAKIAALLGWMSLENKDRFGCLVFDAAEQPGEYDGYVKENQRNYPENSAGNSGEKLFCQSAATFAAEYQESGIGFCYQRFFGI